MKKIFAIASSVAVAMSLSAAPLAAQAAVPFAAIQSGDLIRGASFSAVYYYGRDGFRYVFPNDKTYFTWYADFRTVKFISDTDLATIQIGGNVTYKPGVKMLKINTDPKTYAVDAGGTLRWITSEAAAVGLYGSNWNKMVDDVPDAFFKNYKSGGANIEQSGDFTRSGIMADATDVNHDKRLDFPKHVDIADGSFSGDLTIAPNTAVKFTNKGTMNHTATADDLLWGTGTLKPGESFSRYFKTPGTFTYFCSLHPNMKAKIIVQ